MPHPFRPCLAALGGALLRAMALLSLAALPVGAYAQFPMPSAPAPQDGATLFRNQCGTCHTLSHDEPVRQGPALGGVFGRRAGSVAGFKYSAGFANAAFDWDQPHLDAWLSNPQAVIPGAVMAYRQGNAATRQKIIDWLKEQH